MDHLVEHDAADLARIPGCRRHTAGFAGSRARVFFAMLAHDIREG